jgi:hypothetical protein
VPLAVQQLCKKLVTTVGDSKNGVIDADYSMNTKIVLVKKELSVIASSPVCNVFWRDDIEASVVTLS